MKKILLNFIFTGILLSFSAISTQAQLVLEGGVTAEELIQTLVGVGVTVENVQVNCPEISYGIFNGESTDIGIPNGIIMTSGNIDNAQGPNDSGGASSGSGGGSDADLTAYANQETYDACVFEFDFIPFSDELSFNYVFGSEEYLEYVGSFNDIFAFFITGPNPDDIDNPYSNDNLAIIPGTQTPVSINNVNDESYPEFYVNNGTGFPPDPNTTIQYDGFTTVLTAYAKVIPCQKYHLKIAIADAGDSALDSGVFLQAGSLKTNYAQLSIDNVSTTLQGYDYTVEGCIDAVVKLSSAEPFEQDITYNIILGGTATPGVDYDGVPATVTIPAGQTSASFYINTLEDFETEAGGETINVSISVALGCDSTFTQQVTTTIFDKEPFVVSEDITINKGESVQLSASGADTYAWTPTIGIINPNSANPIAVPEQTTTFVCVGKLGDCTYTDSVTITVVACEAEAGTITLSEQLSTIPCEGGTGSAIIGLQNETLQGYAYTFLLTNSEGNILSQNLDGVFGFENAQAGTYCVYGIEYSTAEGESPNLEVATLAQLQAQANQGDICFDLTECLPITINPLPQLDITATQNCGTLQFSTTGDSNISEYAWNFGQNNATSNEATPTYQYEAGNYSVAVSLLVTNQNGCQNTFTQDFDIATAGSATVPTLTQNLLCYGTTTQATAQAQLYGNQILGYALHNNPTANFNDDNFELYALNTTGEFANNGTFPYNTPLYVSAVVANANNDQLPNLADACLFVSQPAMFTLLRKIKFTIDEHCDFKETGDFTLTFGITGGLPQLNSSETYSIVGDYFGNLAYNEPATLILPEDAPDSYQFLATDANGCAADTTREYYCEKTPVELLRFEGETLPNGNNLLTWVVATETEVLHYQLQRLNPTTNTFETIATIQAHNTQQTNTYQFVDAKPNNDINYYRLLQTDLNNTIHHLGIVSINNASNNTNTPFAIIQATPVPAHNTLTLSVQNTNDNTLLLYQLFDVSGKLVTQTTQNANKGLITKHINLENLNSGLYLLTITDGNNIVSTKILKQ